ncbi:unnamed protein product [Adineta steineri]|uniref:CCZ1/INTU/HSP4 first Longin domain-containing protein n=2 Tax=Adineta steineri TaxID=433720 RepID=A0A814YX05_9BILA|nr:unnamed protein product [Adineta steineri]
MSTLIHQSSVDELRYILKFIQYHIHNMIRDVTIDSSYFDIQYLAIDRRIFLKFQTILRRFQLHFTSLKEMIFIYRDQLISSGLNQDDTITIYSFFRLYYWPHIKNLSHISTIRYLTIDSNAIPADELILSTSLTSQEFFLGNLCIKYRILVIHLHLFTMFCVFPIENNDLSNDEKILSIVELFKNDLEILLPSFQEYLRRKFPISNRELTSPANHLTNTLAEDAQWFHPTGKIMVKRKNDPWIIAKRSDMRELIVIVNQKSANLKEISGKISFIE